MVYIRGMSQGLVQRVPSNQGKYTHLQDRQLEECRGRRLAPFHGLTAASPRHAGGMMFIGRVRVARVLEGSWLTAGLQVECWQVVCKLRMVARWCLLCRRDSMRLDGHPCAQRWSVLRTGGTVSTVSMWTPSKKQFRGLVYLQWASAM
jgi:hypothetical protein